MFSDSVESALSCLTVRSLLSLPLRLRFAPVRLRVVADSAPAAVGITELSKALFCPYATGMKETIATLSLLFLMLLSPASALAQGIIGSDMPKEIFGRTDRTKEEIAALNAELHVRRTILAASAVLLPASVLAFWLRKRRRSI